MVGRAEELMALRMAITAGEHLLFVGPPGTAKTMISETLAKAIGVKFFQTMFKADTVSEELIGPPKISELLNDEYVYNLARRICDCEIAHIDEISRAPSEVQDILLTVMNERKIYNPDEQPIPLRTLVGTTNFLLNEDGSNEAEAFFDRFALRCFVHPVPQSLWMDLLDFEETDYKPNTNFPIPPRSDIKRMNRHTPRSIKQALNDLRGEFAYDKGIYITDRRFMKSLYMVNAHALGCGRTIPEIKDLRILRWMWWHTEDQQKMARDFIDSYADPMEAEVTSLVDEAHRIVNELYSKRGGSDADQIAATANVNERLIEIDERIKQLDANEDDTKALDDYLDEMSNWLVNKMKIRA